MKTWKFEEMRNGCPWLVEKLKPMSYSKLTVGCKGSNYPCAKETCAPYFWFKNLFDIQKIHGEKEQKNE